MHYIRRKLTFDALKFLRDVKTRESCREEEIKFIMEYPGLEDGNLSNRLLWQPING